MHNFLLDRLGALSKLLILSPSQSRVCPKEQSSINKVAGNLFSLLFLFPSLFLGVSYLANSYQSIVFPPLSLPYLTSSLTLWPVCLSLTTLAPLGPPALPTIRPPCRFIIIFFLPYPPRNGTVLAVAASHRSYPPPRASRRFPTKALSSVEGGKQRRREQKKDTRLAWSSACPDWRTETEPKPLGYLRFLLSDFACRVLQAGFVWLSTPHRLMTASNPP